MLGKLIMIFALFANFESAKILIVVPTPSISHQVVFRPIIEELIRRDHELTVLTTDPVYPEGKSPKNLKEIDLHDSYLLWNKMLDSFKKMGESDILSTMSVVYSTASKIFYKQLQDKSVEKLIRNNTLKFDLLIIEACIRPTLIFTHIFKAPVIQISSFGTNPGFMEMIGGVTHPFLYPSPYHQRNYNLTVWEKIIELDNHITFQLMVKRQQIQDDRILQSIFGNDTPPLDELKNNVHMLFLNVHPIWVHNQPVPPNVVYTWGIHQSPKQILNKDLQSYLDSSKNGVIYISFGTNVKSSTIAPEKLLTFLQVFSRLPYDILWKWDMDELPGKPKNVKIAKWLPQCDILRHPNLKLFITQGGLQSTEEAINAGVPLIGIPIFADQNYNTEKYVHFKIGIQLIMKSLTVENFENAIKTILADESYRKNIIHLRTLMQDQPRPPLENAIWWIEYVVRHGGSQHLRTPAANMSWTEYYELELVLVILSGLMVLLTVMILILYTWFKCMSRILNLKINKNKLH